LQEAVDGYKNQGIIIHEPRGDHGKWIASANGFSICSAGTLEDLLEELAGHEMVSVMTYEQAIAEAGRPFAAVTIRSRVPQQLQSSRQQVSCSAVFARPFRRAQPCGDARR
jgi:hypothetical protein